MIGNLFHLGRTSQDIVAAICILVFCFADIYSRRKFDQAWNNLAGLDIFYAWRFRDQHDVELELRKEYYSSRRGLFNPLTSYWRWRLYMIDLPPPEDR
jgi:hypothetical protein